jgi:hypothetical protein
MFRRSFSSNPSHLGNPAKSEQHADGDLVEFHLHGVMINGASRRWHSSFDLFTLPW